MNCTSLKTGACLVALLALMMIAPATLSATAVSSFDDITYWVGTGSNRAAIAIDWIGDDASDTALVWGYRWNGIATGQQMLLNILAEDQRFYARMSSGGAMGVELYGFGYDQNNDGEFELDDGTAFNADGIAITGSSDGAEAGSGDRYREGWSTGYWHYGLANEGPNDWTSSGVGVTSRILSDGDWDSHAFAVTLNNNEFAANLIAAEPSFESIPGDFNNDGMVDAADYTVWRDGLGTTHTTEHYNDWLANFGTTSSSSNAITVPEPAANLLGLLFLMLTSLNKSTCKYQL